MTLWHRLLNGAVGFGAGSSVGVLCLGVFAVLIFKLAPVTIMPNEVHYFALSERFVNPEAFGPNHAIFDASRMRFASYGLIGAVLDLLGQSAGLVLLRLLQAVFYTAALGVFFRTLGLTLAETVVSLMLFILMGESLIGHEWLFSGVEAKTLAYPLSILGLAAALYGRPWSVVACTAGATYMHFLVGGFWALAALGLLLVRTRDLRPVLLALAAYMALCLPLAVLIALEQTATGDLPPITGGVSLNYIYGPFRNPHHVAPFARGSGLLASWIPGLLAVLGLLLVFGLILMRVPLQEDPQGRLRPLLLLLFAINAYLLLAFGASFVDRHTHFLAKLYLFRPSSLALLISISVLASLLSAQLAGRAAALFALAVVLLFPPYAGGELARKGHEVMSWLKNRPALAELETYVRAHTAPAEVVLVEPGPDELRLPKVGLESLLGRPTLVNFKFLPVAPADMVRWYNLVQWRKRVFAGRCELLPRQQVRYILATSSKGREAVQPCGRVVWSNGTYTLVAAMSPTSAR